MARFDPITRRLRQLFAVLDTDDDGFVTWEDHQRMVDAYAEHYSLAPDDARLTALATAYWAQWLGLLAKSAPGRFRLSQEEYVAAHRAVGYDTDRPDLLENLAKALFAVLDSDGDKRISSDEFAAYLAFRGVSGEDAPLVFQRLDLDRDSYLSQREIARSLRAFHLNNDGLHAPGGIFLGIH
ncbi:EF-hand domain-containing protein [Streptomyces sp. NPDC017988]|uniref:EF-hand domain-containing protein n=1 Tax=Streptomyces sp. NPDC017988 TaxID=3365025 RepID=UPI0037ACC06B